MNTNQHSTSKTPFVSIVAVFVALVLSACISSPGLIAPQATRPISAVQAHATSQFAAAQAEAIDSQATADTAAIHATQTTVSTEAQNRLALQSNSATATAQAIASTNEQQISAVMIEQARINATATAVSIQATVNAINRQSQLDQARGISQTFVITSQTALRAEQIQRDRDRANDFFWTLPDYIVHAAPCGGVVLLLLAGWLMVRALAARLAGDSERAEMALRMPSITLMLPAPAPAPPDDPDDVSDNTETRITGYTGNTEKDAGNTPEVITIRQKATTAYLPRLTTEQHLVLSRCKALCLDWLYRARQWDAENGRPNNYIARHHHLKMKPEDAGDAREMLERLEVVYIKQGGKPEEQGTYIMPDYGTIDNVIALIRSGDVRVSPPGFDDTLLKQSADLERAVAALP